MANGYKDIDKRLRDTEISLVRFEGSFEKLQGTVTTLVNAAAEKAHDEKEWRKFLRNTIVGCAATVLSAALLLYLGLK